MSHNQTQCTSQSPGAPSANHAQSCGAPELGEGRCGPGEMTDTGPRGQHPVEMSLSSFKLLRTSLWYHPRRSQCVSFFQGEAAHTNSVACEAGAARSEGSPQTRGFATCKGGGAKGGRAQALLQTGPNGQRTRRGKGLSPFLSLPGKGATKAPAYQRAPHLLAHLR